VSKQELVSWLQSQIADQKRVDTTTSGVSSSFESSYNVPLSSHGHGLSDVQLILPGDAKKLRKQTKQLFLDRGISSSFWVFSRLTDLGLAFDANARIKSAIQGGMSLLAVDVPVSVFHAMTTNSSWIVEDDQWKSILAEFPPQNSAYAAQIREAVIKRKLDDHQAMLLFAVKEERIQLLSLV
jgi:eukaryotic translation initiation factor 2-alpha kinase 4